MLYASDSSVIEWVLVGSLVRDESAQGSSDLIVPLPGGASLLLSRDQPVR